VASGRSWRQRVPGNVIGGGDWAAERLVPDCLRAFAAGRAVQLRYPNALRRGSTCSSAGRLPAAGPSCWAWQQPVCACVELRTDPDADATVVQVATSVARLWGSGARVEAASDGEQPHEAGLLRLDSAAARTVLGWSRVGRSSKR